MDDESPGLFRTAFELVPMGMALVRPDATFLRVNAAFAAILSTTPDALTGRSILEVTHPDDAAITRSLVARALSGETDLIEIEKRYLRRDGSTVVGTVRAALLRRDEGSPLLFVVYLRDASREREREARLVESEERFRIVAGETGELIYDYDVPTGRITWAGAVEEVLGVDASAAEGFSIDSWSAAIHPDERPRVLLALEAAQDKGGPFRQEYRFRRADGVTIDVDDRGTFLRDGRGTSVRMLGVMRDVTAEKAAREELFRSRQMLRAVLDHIPQRVFWKDLGGRYLGGNRRFVDDVGLGRPDELAGKADADLFPPPEAEENREGDRQVMESGSPLLEFEEPVRMADEGERWVRTSKVPLRDRDGHVIGVLGTYDDITERKRAQVELRAVNARLRSQVEELERRGRELALLAEMGDHFQACRTHAEACAVAERILPRFFPALSGRLFVQQDEELPMTRAAAWGEALETMGAPGPDDCWAVRRGRPHRSGGASGGVPCGHLPPNESLAALCVPLLSQGELYGLLTVGAPEEAGPPPDPSLCVSVAEHVALALANLRLTERLRHQAEHDPLTGLFNRRHLDVVLPREIHRAGRSQAPVSLVVADIDRFKDFNDRFGHEAGDSVLRAIGTFLATHVRAGDIACRFGGEEFVLVLPETLVADAERRAEELRCEVKGVDTHSLGAGLPPLSLSLGVAQYPLHARTAAELFRAADAALYRAKSQGRDRVAIARTGETLAALAG